MPRATPPLPPALAHAAFTYREAIDAGVSRRRLGHPDIRRVQHGVYARPSADDVVARCAELVPLLGERRWFSHLTAARLWGIPSPFPWTPGESVHVLAAAGAEPLRRPGIVGWETADPCAAVVRCGIPVMTAAATWVQLAVPGATASGRRRRGAFEVPWLVAAGDHLLTGPRAPGGRTPLCTLDELADAVRAHRGKRGAKALAAALPLLRPGPQSPRESLLRLGLVERGLPEPTVQPPVATAAGIRHPDLGYLDGRVLLEYQGDHHRTDARQWREDLRRQQLFEDAGYRVIAVTLDDFDDGCLSLASRVRRALSGRTFLP